jgi:Arc/MetJ-type ribon-helix-helix transcriptional regulator
MVKKDRKDEIRIPDFMMCEIDHMILETGLYRDNTEFVSDAVRHLIEKTKQEEISKSVRTIHKSELRLMEYKASNKGVLKGTNARTHSKKC